MKTRGVLALVVALAVLTMSAASANVIGGQGKQETRPMDLFGNQSKLKVGDMVTILVQEQVDVDSGVIHNEKAGDTTFSVFAVVPGLASLGNRERKQENTTEQTHGLRTAMTVRVISVDADGNMQLEGTRVIQANGRKVSMNLAAMARPQDVNPDNTVLSTRLVNMDLKVDGLPRKQGFDFFRSIFGIFF